MANTSVMHKQHPQQQQQQQPQHQQQQVNSDEPASPFSPLSLRPTRCLAQRGQAPTIVESLKAQEIKVGDNLYLKCVVPADPTPEITWSKNNIQLNENRKVSLKSSPDGILELALTDSKPEDSGVYLVTVKNILGIAKISCQILVSSPDPFSIGSTIENLSGMKRIAVFEKWPEDRVVNLLETVIIEFKIRSFLDTKLLWLLNNKPLQATTRISTVFDGTNGKLVIRKFSEADAGLYTIVVINSDGEVRKDIFINFAGSKVSRDTSAGAAVEKRRLVQQPHVYLERSLRPVEGKIVRLEESAPFFVRTIRNSNIALGSSITFTAFIKGHPAPQVTWHFNNRQIDDSNHHRTSHDQDSDAYSLRISEAQQLDLGTYTLTATNAHGSVSCSARLSQETEDADLSTKKTLFELPGISSATVPAEPMLIKSGVETTSLVGMESIRNLESSVKQRESTDIEFGEMKPYLVQPLQNLSVLEGEEIRLAAKVQTISGPQVLWFKDNGPVPSSSRFSFVYDHTKGKVMLVIKSSVLSDSGLYALVVRNPKGTVTCHGTVRVTRTPTIDSRAMVTSEQFGILDMDKKKRQEDFTPGVDVETHTPSIEGIRKLQQENRDVMSAVGTIEPRKQILKFDETLQSINTQEGQNVTLSALISAYPPPVCNWYHNGSPIATGSRYTVQYDRYTRLASLSMQYVTMEDAGDYKLTAQNSAGAISSDAKISINVVPSIDRTTKREQTTYASLEKVVEHPEFQAGVDQSSYANIEAIRAADKQKLIRPFEVLEPTPKMPFFTSELSDITCSDGTTTIFRINVDGIPIPQIEWFKDSRPVQASNRIVPNYDLKSKCATLMLKHVMPNDQGQYEIRAANSAGTASRTAKLTVLQSSSIETKPFISPDVFQNLERREPVPDTTTPGVDHTSFIDKSRFEGLEMTKIISHDYVEDTSRYAAPRIIAALPDNLRIKETAVVQLVSVIDGYPIPEFTWMKNNQPLMYSNRIQCDYNLASKLCCLTIKHAQLSDAGTYTLQAKNQVSSTHGNTNVIVDPIRSIDRENMLPEHTLDQLEIKPVVVDATISGVDRTSVIGFEAFTGLEAPKPKHQITVHELDHTPPVIIQPLANTRGNEGEDVCLLVQVFGIPLPEVTWYKNGRKINESSRFVVFHDILNKTIYLFIKKAIAEDSGQYSIHAKNSVGAVTCQSQLFVSRVGKPVDDAYFVSPDHFQGLEPVRPDLYKSLVPGVDKTGFIDQAKLAPLEEKKLVPIPEPVEKLVPPTAKFAKENYEVLEGEYTSLVANVTGSPMPQVTWHLNGREISASNLMSPFVDPHAKTATLSIKSALKKMHHGQYDLVAVNEAGRASATCRLLVSDSPSIDDKGFRSLSSFVELERQPEVKVFEAGLDQRPMTQCTDKFNALDVKTIVHPDFVEDTSEHRAPQFIKPLSDTECAELCTVVLSTVCDGNPSPSFLWMKNDVPLATSNRHSTHYDLYSKTISLCIQHVTPVDAGKYSLLAINPLTKCQTSCSLTVKSIADINRQAYKPEKAFVGLENTISKNEFVGPVIDTQSYVSNLQKILAVDQAPEKPYDVKPGVDLQSFVSEPTKFQTLDVKPVRPIFELVDTNERFAPVIQSAFPESIQIKELDHLALHATVDGYPEPEFRWKLNGVLVDASNRYIFTYDRRTHLLYVQIRNVTKKDAGFHSIEVKNTAGFAEMKFNLLVTRTSSIEKDGYIPMDMINRLEDSRKMPARIYDAGIDTSTFLDQELYRKLEEPGPQRPEIIPGIDQTTYADMTTIRSLDISKPRAPQEVHEIPHISPKFMSEVQSMLCEELADVVLSATVVGVPLPTFTWTRNGIMIPIGSRFISHYNLLSKTIYMLIHHARCEDAGTYTLTAKNPQGQTESSCTLTVTATPSIAEDGFVPAERFQTLDDTTVIDKYIDMVPGVDSQQMVDSTKFAGLEVERKKEPVSVEVQYTNLSIAKPMSDVECQDNETFVLSAVINGSPIEEFHWYFNGRPITASNNMVTKFDYYTHTFYLIIYKANSKLHTGQYSIFAKNKLNQVECKCKVNVVAIASIDTRSSRDANKYQKLEVSISKPELKSHEIDRKPITKALDKILSLDTKQVEAIPEQPMPTKKPFFLGPVSLSMPNLAEMDNVTISVQADGSPSPQFYWMKDGSPLMYSNRFAIHYDRNTKVLTFHIRGLTLADRGSYYVVAKNEAGNAMSNTVSFDVQATDKIDTRNFKPREPFQKLDSRHLPIKEFTAGVDKTALAGNWSKLSEFDQKMMPMIDVIPGIDTSSSMNTDKLRSLDHEKIKQTEFKEDTSFHRKPQLLSNLAEFDVSEMQNVLLSVMVDATPIPEYQWAKDGKVISKSNRLTPSYDPYSKILSLLVKAVTVRDAGKYTLTAKNYLGDVQASTSLRVHPIQSVDKASYFQSEMEILDQLEAKREPIQYEAGIDRSSMIDASVLNELDKSKLVAKTYDAGIDASAMIDECKFNMLERPITRTEFEDDKSAYRAPMILHPFSGLMVKEGDSWYISCVIEAYPLPSFEWMKDSVPIFASNRYQSSYDINSKLLSMAVQKAQLADAGSYSVIVKNEAGSCHAAVDLGVNQIPGIEYASYHPDMVPKITDLDSATAPHVVSVPEETQETPQFQASRKSEDIEVCEGSSVSVQVQLVKGRPWPCFTWKKDGLSLEASNRFLHHFDIKHSMLLFKLAYAYARDSGKYVVEAKNASGSCTYEFNLKVTPIPSIDRNPAVKNLAAIDSLEETLKRQLPVTILTSSVDTTTYVSDIDKYTAFDAEKPKLQPTVLTRKKNLAPQFIQQMSEMTVNELENVILMAKLNDAYPVCKIQWFRNRMEIRASSKCQPGYDLSTCELTLLITKCNMRDAGQYSVTATNSSGSVNLTTMLTVSPVDTIDTQTSRTIETYQSLDVKPKPEGLERSEIVTKPVIDENAWNSVKTLEKDLAARQIPRMIQVKDQDRVKIQIVKHPEKEMKVEDGDDVIITATVTGLPIPLLTWYKNDTPMLNANRFVSQYDLLTKVVTLKMNKAVARTDTAKYRLECIDVDGNRIYSDYCTLSVAPTESIKRDVLVKSDRALREIDNLSQLRQQEKSMLYAQQKSGIDSECRVPLDRFSMLEQQQKVLIPIQAGVDQSGFVPVERFSELERQIPLRTFVAGIDKSPIISQDTLVDLNRLDSNRAVEVHEPLVKVAKLKLVMGLDAVEKSHAAIEGMPSSLTCLVEAYPMPTVTWRHNGQSMASSQRILPHYDPFSGQITLHFMVTYSRDAGLYEVTVGNTEGQVTSQVQVTVEPESGIDETAYVGIGESWSTIKRGADSFEFDKLKTTQKESLDFVEFPVEALRGVPCETLRINYKPVGGPNSEVHWLFNGVEITETLNIHIDENGVHSFTLSDLQANQCGTYTCQILNMNGQFSRNVQVKWLGTVGGAERDRTPPSFIKDMNSVIVREGDTAKLLVSVYGIPVPELCWLKNDMPLMNSSNVKTRKIDDRDYELTVENAKRSDGGWYQCVANNPVGSAVSKAKLIVAAGDMEAKEMPFNPTALRSVSRVPEEDIRRKYMKEVVEQKEQDPRELFFSQLRRSSKLAQGANANTTDVFTEQDTYQPMQKKPPEFKIQLPDTLETSNGQDCELQVTVVPVNDPTMEVKWMKNNQTIEAGNRTQAIFEMGYATLQIKNVSPDDFGRYDCCATNKCGTAKTSCLVLGSPTRQVDFGSNLPESRLRKIAELENLGSFTGTNIPAAHAKPMGENAPQVVVPLHDAEGKEGSSLKLTTKITSQPKARITWQINGKPVFNAGRFSISNDGMLDILTINKCRALDTGTVKCIAKNRSGEVCSTCSLNILPGSKPVYWDMVLDAALEIDLSPEEMAVIEAELQKRIATHPMADAAKAEGEAIAKKYIEELRAKYKQRAALKPKQKKPTSDGEVELRSPCFIRQLMPSTIAEDGGGSLLLSVRYEPRNCSVAWMKNHGQVQNSKEFQIKIRESEGSSCLYIPSLFEQDAGLYSCKISTAFGFTVSETTVRVDKTESLSTVDPPVSRTAGIGSAISFICQSRNKVRWVRTDEGKMPPPSRCVKQQLESNQFRMQINRVEQGDQGEYACEVLDGNQANRYNFSLTVVQSGKTAVLKPLTCSDAVEGKLAVLECQIETTKNDEVTWSKDGVVLQPGGIYEQLNLAGRYVLKIFNTSSDYDSGTYACTSAENPGVTTETKVSIAKMSNEEERARRPIIATAIKSLTVIEDDPAVFEVVVTDQSPQPEIEWRKDNRPLPLSQDYQIRQKDNRGILMLRNTFIEDGGVYACYVTQNQVTSTCSALLTIRKKLR